MIAKFDFLTPQWIERFNEVIGRAERPVRPPTPRGSVVALRTTTGGPDLALEIREHRPTLSLLNAPAATAGSVSLSSRLLTSALVDGRMDLVSEALHSGEVEAEGEREILLYYLYHLFPNGPQGADEAAREIREFTTVSPDASQSRISE